MIEYARRKKIFVRLSTNGYFLEGENIYSLVYSGLNDLIISLDYIDKELYKSFKGVDCFAAVVKNIRTLVE